MPSNTPANQLQELIRLGDIMVKANKADKKVAKKRRHKAYMSKRIAEATKMWDNYNKQLTEVKTKVKADDPCLTSVTDKYSEVYREYTERLLTDTQNAKSDTESESESENDDIQEKQDRQGKRFTALKRILSEVEFKQDHGETPSVAFITIKTKRINELWERIEIENESIQEASESDPSYETEYSQTEILMENALMFLQENLPTRGTNNQNEGIKLNRVEIQKFAGDYFKWVTFRDLFQSLVIDNKNLTNSQRMQMLKTHVTGEAEKLIGDLTISEANFEGAWLRLVSRYDNNRVVVNKLINKLMNQQQCKEDSKSIKALLDTTDQVLLALKNMGRPVEEWDDWIIVLITQKLSDASHKDWEQDIGDTTALPTWEKLKVFLEKQFRMLERVEGSSKRQAHNQGQKDKQSIRSYQSSMESAACVVCKERHTLYKCQKWLDMDPKNRWDVARQQKWCFLCLKKHEGKKRCDKEKPCKKCTKKHSTWLHQTEEKGDELGTHHRTISTLNYETLLATAVIKTNDATGQTITLRALVDSGSEGSMITEDAAQRLRLRKKKSDKWVSGLNGNKSGLLSTIQMYIKPRFDSTFSLKGKFYIMTTLTKTLPNKNLMTKSWHHIKDLVWADPQFHRKGKIDILLGMDVIVDILKGGLIKGIQGQPMAQETELGWIMSGNIDPQYSPVNVNCYTVKLNEDMVDLQRFWELEELNPVRALTMDEQQCEQHYENNVRQTKGGAFVVRIPFKSGDSGPERLGESRGQALARFLQLEKRFAKDELLKKEYVKVIQEYIDLNHVKEVTNEPQENKKYYIPHHAVVKPESLTTKTRVVFDASAKTSTGVSLNECMYIGAKQQRDLTEILLKWRLYKIVVKADVEKMYRMIQLDERDQKYHTFFWRSEANDELKEYQMKAVTFGTAAAPFLATRTMKQMAMNMKDTYPLAAACLKDEFYVDDLMGGSHSVGEAIQCKDELITALSKCNFRLREWTSNTPAVLASLPSEMTEKSLQIFSEKETSKALGICWSPYSDEFQFICNWTLAEVTSWTKRQFLSEASKIFDPLGWLAPVTINAKIMMQDIWRSKIDWDDMIPEHIKMGWTQFRAEIPVLKTLRISRWMSYEPGCEISIHGFSDASEKAYSAVVYARVKRDNNVIVKLVASKTRVAPVNSKITLPRLELCGAVLVANLIDMVIKSFDMEGLQTHAWTDSMITLGWIQGEPSTWKTFVANRVAEIQAHKLEEWRYVPSEQNPADCASRGIMPDELSNHELWWNGPSWLKEESDKWPQVEVADHQEDQRNNIAGYAAQVEANDTVEAISSWDKLKRIAAYCRRFKTKCKDNLTAQELADAEIHLIKKCQEEHFPRDMQDLADNKPVHRTSKLKSLNPFLDMNGVIRVGGRLVNAPIAYNTKHPIILPERSHLTKPIISQSHINTLHGGPTLMRHTLMKKFWIIQAKRMIHNEYTRCTTCRRFSAQSFKQKMGDLPEARVKFNRVFHETGVDYAGPIEVKSSKLRNAKIEKGYIAVYVCMSTKAVHLELVSDQTSEAFLASFERFVARRSLPAIMHSDNGRTFVGGANQLEKQMIHQRNREIATLMVNKGVEWKFIPEGSPNFGGLWERAVRSMKDHVKRTLKTARLTFEEYSTVLCQVEACLNSRPLCALTNNTEDLDALTPGHFLIGTSLLAPPESTMGETKMTSHKRWQYVQLLQRQLWERWNKEYLVELQQRHKWQHTSKNVSKGELVIIKDEDLPPRNWLLGRIEDVHPGNDGQIRVATIRIANNVANGNKIVKKKTDKDWKHWLKTPTKTTTIKRPIRKLCPLMTSEVMQPLVNQINQQKQAQIQAQQVNRRVLRPRPQRGINIAFVMLGILFLCLQGMAEPIKDCIKLMPFQNNPGIYFENMGRASMTHSEWTLVVYFDLQKYYAELQSIDDATADLRALCHEVSKDDKGVHCGNIVELLQVRVDEIHHMNVLIKMNKHASESGRSRRSAPLNIVGWIGHELFGIMDEKRARILERKILDLKTNQVHLKELARNQTSIMELTVNLMKTTQNQLSTGMGSLTNALAILKNQTDLVRRKEQVLGWAIYTSLLIGRIEKIQRDMVNMLTDLQQGHVSSYLFTPHQFKEQLNTINDQIPVGSKLPLDPQHDMRSFYEIMKGRMRVTERHVLLEIILPLVSIAEFQVFYLIPVPFQHDGEHMSIIPESKYLLITLQRDRFYQMNDHDLDECIKPQDAAIICQSKRPMNNMQSTRSKCERDLLAKRNEFSNHCRINVTHTQESWIQLKEKNTWIYGLHNETTMNVVHESNVETVTLQGSGKMEVSPGCEVTQHGLTMIGQAKMNTKSSYDFQPTMNLSRIIHEHHPDLKFINVTMDNEQQFKEIYSRLEGTKISSVQSQLAHNWQTGINITIIMMIFALIVWYNRDKIQFWSSRCKQNKNDMEQNGTQQAILPIAAARSITTEMNELNEISVDNEQIQSSTIDRHGPGGCPFRK